MKAIFRGVLIMNYTDNQENVTVDQLRDYLKQQNTYNEETLKTYIEQFALLIEELINSPTQEAQENAYLQFGLQPTQSAELNTVWQSEKDRVYSHIIKQNTHGKKLEKLQWSVNNQFYGKKVKNMNQATCIVNVKTKNLNTKQFQFNTFEMNSQDVGYFEEQLKKIEQTVNALLI